MLVFQKCSNECHNEKATRSTCFVYKHEELNSTVGINKVHGFRKRQMLAILRENNEF